MKTSIYEMAHIAPGGERVTVFAVVERGKRDSRGFRTRRVVQRAYYVNRKPVTFATARRVAGADIFRAA